MSDPATVSPTSELKVLIQGAADNIVVKDKNGNAYKLQPLDLADFCEYEDRTGTSFLMMNFSTLKLQDIVFMFYLSLRKDGLSPKEVDDRKFPFSESEFKRRFDMKLFSNAAVLLTDLLRISGLDMKANPQAAN